MLCLRLGCFFAGLSRFFSYFLNDQGSQLAGEVGYIPLPKKTRAKIQARFDARTTGSMFEDGSKVGATLDEML